MARSAAVAHSFIALLFASLAASQTCYVAPNTAAEDFVVPCGNNGACCQLGDTCLEDSACFNYATTVTYLYGCTDSSYSSSACPWKCGSNYTDAPYVGVEYCGLNGGGIWTCTQPPNSDAQVAAQPGQECAGDSQIAFAGPAVLDPILSLPSSAGGSTGYFSTIDSTSFSVVSGYTPDVQPAFAAPSKPSTPEQVSPQPTTTTPSATPSQTTTSTPSSTHSPTPSTTPAPTSSITSSRTPSGNSAAATTSSVESTSSIPRSTTSQRSSSSTSPSYSGSSTTASLSPSPTPQPTTASYSPSSSPTTYSSAIASSPSSPSSIAFTKSLTSSPPPTSSVFTSTSTTGTAAAASNTGAVAPGPASGLSTGAKAGIGVGVAGGVLFLAALALFFFLWRRRKRSHEPVPQQEVAYSHPYSPEVSRLETSPYTPHSPYSDNPAVIPPGGAFGVGGRHELPGDRPTHSNNRYSGKTGDGSSELDTNSSPAPTYNTWGSSTTPGRGRPAHGNSLHELGQNF